MRSTTRTTTGGSRGSAFAFRPTDRWVVRGGYGITQYMEGTGANLRLPLNPPFFFESEVRYDTTSGGGTIATGFEGLQPLDRPSGQLRAWDPELRPQFTQQWNVFVEYLLGSRSSINVGYVGNWSTELVTPIDGNQPLPGTGDPATWLPVQQRRPLYPFNPDIASISTTASRGRSNYNGLQSTFKQRLWQGLDFVANYTWSKSMANNSGYFGNNGVAGEGAYPMNSYDIEANYGPAAYDARHIVSVAGSYDLPVRPGPAVRERLEPRARRGGRRLVDQLRAHGAHRVPDHGHRWIEPVAPGLALARAAEPHRQRRGGRPDPRALDRSRGLRVRAARVVRRLRRRHPPHARLLEHRRLREQAVRRPFGRQYFMIRGEMFNSLNHPNFGPPQVNIQSTAFGTITSTVGDARIVQLVAKYYF